MGVNCDGLSGEDIGLKVCQFKVKLPDWSEPLELPELFDREREYIIHLEIMSNTDFNVVSGEARPEPIILAIDTSSPYASLAISSGENIVASLAVRSSLPHSQALFSHISAILELAEIKINDISAFAVATGPGSFTGLRVGLAAIKGLADSLGKPSLGVDSLDLLALAPGSDGMRLAMISAGRSEVYCGLREVVAGQIISRSTADKVGKPQSALRALMQYLKRSPLIVTGAEGLKYKNEVLEFINDSKVINPESVVFLGEPLNAPSILARRAARLIKQNQLFPITPHYVRPSDAEMKWKR